MFVQYSELSAFEAASVAARNGIEPVNSLIRSEVEPLVWLPGAGRSQLAVWALRRVRPQRHR
jgi:hypothetical protein